MRVNEIFSSIEGEGKRAGELCTFVRLAGCNLRCSYCDTVYAQMSGDGKKMCVTEIIAVVKGLGNKNVTITGGEPLIQDDINNLISALLIHGYSVNIETNGSIDISRFLHIGDLFFTMDYKCPSSGMDNRMIERNYNALMKEYVLKFVVGSEADLDAAKAIIQRYNPKCHIYFSPVFGKIEPAEIVEYMKKHNMQNVKLQLQLHKIIWDPATRGV